MAIEGDPGQKTVGGDSALQGDNKSGHYYRHHVRIGILELIPDLSCHMVIAVKDYWKNQGVFGTSQRVTVLTVDQVARSETSNPKRQIFILF